MEKGSHFRTIISSVFDIVPNLPLYGVIYLRAEWSYFYWTLTGSAVSLRGPYVDVLSFISCPQWNGY